MTPSNLSTNPARRIVYRLALAAVGMLAAAGFATLEAEIIVGNPSIADVAIQSGNILVITGKSFGITNIIALDAERNVIQDQRVSVRRDEAGVVNLHKGIARQTYACLPQCNPTITVGDDAAYMSTVLRLSKEKMAFSEGAQQDSGQQAGN